MNIFNSLGSNYNLKFVFKALLARNNDSNLNYLKNFLEKKYTGKAIFVYKGREALELALRMLNLSKDSSVAINGFTCFAVYKAIANAGLMVEYLDLENMNLNFSPKQLREKLKENPKIKVLIIQNTLGYPCEIEEISKICQQKGIILIEDLAHSVGLVYASGKTAGTVGDFTVMSFSQDKIIDGISGGALIIRNEKFHKDSPGFSEINNHQQFIDRLYPLFTYLIRKTYQFQIGKVLHAVLKKINLLSKPMPDQDDSKLHFLSGWYFDIIKNQFDCLSANLKHRRKIAAIYAEDLSPKILFKNLIQKIPNSTNLRFPIFVRKRSNLINFLKNQGVYISDIWYEAPIAPKRYLSQTNYKNQCPESEKISSLILNLPTHQDISEETARQISKGVNQWLKSQ